MCSVSTLSLGPSESGPKDGEGPSAQLLGGLARVEWAFQAVSETRPLGAMNIGRTKLYILDGGQPKIRVSSSFQKTTTVFISNYVGVDTDGHHPFTPTTITHSLR